MSNTPNSKIITPMMTSSVPAATRRSAMPRAAYRQGEQADNATGRLLNHGRHAVAADPDSTISGSNG